MKPKTLLPLLVIFTAWVLFFSGLPDRMIIFRDSFPEFYPEWKFLILTYARGFFPLWIPDLNCGMPFLGWSHAAALYPAGLIFALWDYAQAVWVNEWIHALIYSVGLFYLCRRLGASGFSALLAVLIGGALEVLNTVGNFLPATRTGTAPLATGRRRLRGWRRSSSTSRASLM